MKRWIPKHYDQQHSAALPSSRRCYARRLAFERCEARRMLSGVSLTTPVLLAPNVYEGGFITVSTAGFLQTEANNFLFDADSLSFTANGFTSFDFDYVVSDATVRFGQPLGTLNAVDDSGSGAALSIAAPTLGPTHGPTLVEFDLSDTLFIKPADPPVEKIDSSVEPKIVVDTSHDSLANVPQGLSGNTTKPLVIEDPIRIGPVSLNSRNTDDSDVREGGALAVAAMVNTTQRAYETQLSAVIANNLNRDGLLPTAAPNRVRPVVAELARAVAFETIGQQAIPTSEIDRVIGGPLHEPSQTTQPTLEPVAAQPRDTPSAGDWAAGKAAIDATNTHTAIIFRDGEETSADLAERIENEQHAAQISIATFAQWPTLATVIAGYLLLERRSDPSSPAVQTPPRYRRRCFGGLGGWK